MKIASWNVNSIKARREHLTRWLLSEQPDVVMLQELKCVAEDFPHLEINGLGYHTQLVGQKTYNGVAILTRQPAQIVQTALPGDPDDPQARYIEITLPGNYRLINVYVPNGQEVGSDKFAYKLKFYDRLYAHLQNVLKTEDRIIMGGDFNVAFENIDVFDAKVLREQILFSTPERASLYKILHLGFTDCFRAMNPTAHDFSWWDYRSGGFERNLGLRIDYLFASANAAQNLQKCVIDSAPRKWEKPSDHAPVVAVFAA